MAAFVVTLQGGAPWGLRLQGGSGTGEPLRIAKINPGSKAARAQLHIGDLVETVNGVRTSHLPLPQAQKLLHNNTNDLQLKIIRNNNNSINGSYHPQVSMSTQSTFAVTNDSGFSGTGSTTSPQISPTNGFPMNPQQQKEELPPPLTDIPNNNNNLRKDEDEFWPPPPPPDESIWSPNRGSSPTFTPMENAPPPPSSREGNISAPVWTPSGIQPVKKEFKSVKPDLTNKDRPRTSSVKGPTYSAPPTTESPFAWAPPSQNPGDSAPSRVPGQYQPSSSPQRGVQPPPHVDTLQDPSHMLSPSYVSPRSPSQSGSRSPSQSGQHSPSHSAPRSPNQPAPYSQQQYGDPEAHRAPSYEGGGASSSPRPIPHSPSRQTPGSHSTPPIDYEGLPNGYGFLPSSALSGSPSGYSTENLPEGALFQKQTIEGDVVHTDTFYPVQGMTRKTSSTTKHEAPSYEGIGPRDKDGLPLGLRQHVKEENKKDWYKEMFKNIHKTDKDEEGDWKSVSSEHKGSYDPGRIVNNTPSYRMQPGKIHDYEPGHSALADQERKVQSMKDGPYNPARRLSAPGSGYASDEEARKAYRSFVKSGELPASHGFGFGAPQARRDLRPTTTSMTQSQLPPQQPTTSSQLPNSSSLRATSSTQLPSSSLERLPVTSTNHYNPHQSSHLPRPASIHSLPTTPIQSAPFMGSTASLGSATSAEPSPAFRGAAPANWGGAPVGGGGSGLADWDRGAPISRTMSLSRGTGLPKKKQRYSIGSNLSAAERLGIKSPPPARLPASNTTKHQPADSRYDYMNQYNLPDRAKQQPKKEYREPDASYAKSLPEYNPLKSPAITDGRFDDFEFSPPVTVLAKKQEVPPTVERSPSLYAKITRASAIALYPFTAQSKKELSFRKGDTIYLTREIDKNWYEGEHHGNRGIFPRSYVEIVTSLEEAKNLLVNAPTTEGKGRAKYKFKGETTTELSVNKGDIVDLIRRVDDNWWEVRQGSRAGIIPTAYLEVLREPKEGMMSPQLSPGGLSRSPHSPQMRGQVSPQTRAAVSPIPINKSPSYQTQSSNPIHSYSSPPPSSPTIRDRVGYSPHSGAGRGGKPSQNAGFSQRGYPEGERYSAVYSYQPSNDDELELMEGETVIVMEKCDDGWFVGFSEATGQFGTFPGNYVERQL